MTGIKIDISTSHAKERHDAAEVDEIREKCTGLPYWFNPVTRYAVRWCQLDSGRIGYQVMRWVQKMTFWKEVTSFAEDPRAGMEAWAQVEEYLVNAGYVNIEWLAP